MAAPRPRCGPGAALVARHACFATKAALQAAVRWRNALCGRRCKCQTSKPRRLVLVCVHAECAFRVLATVPEWDLVARRWWVGEAVLAHTCAPPPAMARVCDLTLAEWASSGVQEGATRARDVQAAARSWGLSMSRRTAGRLLRARTPRKRAAPTTRRPCSRPARRRRVATKEPTTAPNMASRVRRLAAAGTGAAAMAVAVAVAVATSPVVVATSPAPRPVAVTSPPPPVDGQKAGPGPGTDCPVQRDAGAGAGTLGGMCTGAAQGAGEGLVVGDVDVPAAGTAEGPEQGGVVVPGVIAPAAGEGVEPSAGGAPVAGAGAARGGVAAGIDQGQVEGRGAAGDSVGGGEGEGDGLAEGAEEGKGDAQQGLTGGGDEGGAGTAGTGDSAGQDISATCLEAACADGSWRVHGFHVFPACVQAVAADDGWFTCGAVDAVARQLHLQHVAGIADAMQHGARVTPCWMHAGGGSGCTGDRISILGSSELLLLERAPGHPAAQELQSAFFQHVDVFRTRLVALSVCVAYNHWVAVALHMGQLAIAVYDSWQVHPGRRAYNKQIKAAALAMLRHLAAERGHPFEASRWSMAYVRVQQQQPNTVDCGLHTLLFLEALLLLPAGTSVRCLEVIKVNAGQVSHLRGVVAAFLRHTPRGGGGGGVDEWAALAAGGARLGDLVRRVGGMRPIHLEHEARACARARVASAGGRCGRQRARRAPQGRAGVSVRAVMTTSSTSAGYVAYGGGSRQLHAATRYQQQL